jgi:hypothetical protein
VKRDAPRRDRDDAARAAGRGDQEDREDREGNEQAEWLTALFRERYAEAGIAGAMQLAAEIFGSTSSGAEKMIEEVCKGEGQFVFRIGGRLVAD